MTTVVKVRACCSKEKQVEVTVNSAAGREHYVLQDGEEKELYAYDDRVVTVNEVLKVPA